MKAEEIQPGDELVTDGKRVYEVELTMRQPPHIVAVVRYDVDGGSGQRMWEIGQDTPLTRPGT